jgi:alpha-beta hydrolase superfamily lysophospholipase
MSALLPHIKKAMPEADVQLFEYGFMGFWRARWDNKKVAKKLAELSKAVKDSGEKLIWITHSNGGAIAYLTTKVYNIKPDMVVQINPALDRWLTPNSPLVEVIHSDQDRAVDLSQWLPFHIWGDQGKVGYKGSKHNVENINASKLQDSMAYYGHQGLFGSPRIASWAAYIANRIALNFLHRNRG